jgi:hypothetical protein
MRDKPDGRFERLVAAAVEGTATSEQLQELHNWLEEPERMQWYLDYVQLDCELSDARVLATIVPRQRKQSKSKRWLLLLPLAAAAAIVLIWIQPKGEVEESAIAEFAIPDPSAPVSGLTLAGAHEPVWESEGRLGFQDDVPMDRQVRMKSGLLALQARGARVVVEGPAAFSAKPKGGGIRLEYGKIHVNTGTQGRGFTVDAGEFAFVDIGTSFGVTHAPMQRRTAVSVYHGIVQVNSANGVVATVHAGKSWESSTKGSKKGKADVADYVTQLVQRDGIVAVGGDVRAIYPALPAVRQKASQRFVTLYRERTDWRPKARVKLDAAPDGTGMLAKDTGVDAYVLAFAPLDEDAQRLGGVIRFQQPIVGLVWDPETLVTTNPPDSIDWPKDPQERPVGFDEGDQLRLIDDHTLKISVSTRYVDVLRVFTAAEK